MSAKPYTLTLRIDGAVRPITSLDTLLLDVATALQREIASIDVAYTRPIPHKACERILYRALGGKLPEDEICLSIYSHGELVFVTFQQDDAEWVAETGSPQSGAKTSLRTQHGEPWEVDANECMPKTTVAQLIQEFVTTKRKPMSVKWRQS